MHLKNYQEKVVSVLKEFFTEAQAQLQEYNEAPPKYKTMMNWVQTAFSKTNRKYVDGCKNGLHEYYPRIVLKVPTGGGKTLLAIESIQEYQELFRQKKTGLVVWIVPSETIYSQTLNKLTDKTNPLRQLLDRASGDRTLIKQKGERLLAQDIEQNLVILFIMIQSVNRKNGKEALKVFQDSGGFDDFFPAETRTDLHTELLEKCPNLDLLSELGPLVNTSLANAVRLSNPLIIIDEIHKVFSDTAKKTIDSLNPACILGLTATPKSDMNILVSVTGLELKDEEMIKLDMHIIPPVKPSSEDWKTMIKEITEHQKRLETKAIEYREKDGLFIRPIALLQVERTGKEQRGKGFVHSLDVKEYLEALGINSDEIAIKSSSQNDIEDVDLFSQACNIRYIITKEALREGWDCSFAYILGIIPNVNSNTGVTQLVGRILRQPYAQKTGIPELDGSYVYYSKGEVSKILGSVSSGLTNEGLEDITGNITVDKTDGENTHTKTITIRDEYKGKFSNAFYLPVWVMLDIAEDHELFPRRFSYERDIASKVDLSTFILTEDIIKELQLAMSTEQKRRFSKTITLDKQSKIDITTQYDEYESAAEISVDYITRRYNELLNNPFLARIIAQEHLKALKEKLGDDLTGDNFDFIASFLYKRMESYKMQVEEALFLDYLNKKQLLLAVSDIPELSFKIPEMDRITIGREPNPYNYYLFDDVELTAMNSFERKVGDLLDKQEKILWWFRNKVNRSWYSIQGWQKHKIRPDFVTAKKTDTGKLELVYILESKGKHLLGNSDTEYKEKMFSIMTEESKKRQ